MIYRLTLSCFCLSLLVQLDAVAAPMPSLKPAAPASDHVSPSDEALLRAVFGALNDRRYTLADQLRADLDDPVARSLADWALYRSNADGIAPEEYGRFLSAHPDWPQSITIQNKAEELLEDDTDPARILAFFDNREPTSGQGMIQLGRALAETGETARGAEYLRRAWVERNWSSKTEREILAKYGAVLRTEDHIAKADRQLFAIRATATESIVDLLPPKERAEARTRIAFLKSDRNAPALYETLPAASKEDAGVLHAAMRYYRRRDEDFTATLIASRAPLDGDGLRDAGAWLRERRLLARTALKEGRFRDAYLLSAYSGLDGGADFAEAEFMAGWVALRFLGEPEMAQAHFAYLTTGVTSPISLGRGLYWLGRAHDAAGETTEAEAAYRAAATHAYTYYGQLAAERLGETGPTFPLELALTPEAQAAFDARPMVRAMKMAAEIGEDVTFDRFARALDDELTDADEVRAYADLVRGERKPYLAVRAAKVARGNGAEAPEIVYPLIAVPEEAGGYVEIPLVLGLSRQESEFNPRAYSTARARGLMQMIDSTARLTARKEGLPYSRNRLMDDPAYNLTLGAAHLSHLLERFGGSYVMVLAAYNAGPHRVDTWIEEYGDPRDPSVDPVDWVELIPFSETRNYVQRVLENTQVYRARLGGGPIAGNLTRDITRGGASADAIGQAIPSPTLLRIAAEAELPNAMNVPQAEPRAMAQREAFPPLHEVPTQVPVPTTKPETGRGD